MPTDTKAESKKSSETADVAIHTGTPTISARALLRTPVIIKREKVKDKTKDKKKYTKGTKGLQRLVLGASRAAFRSSNSFAEGFRTFVKKSNKSARKRRDGLVRDALTNASRGFSEGLTQLGKAPGEIARRVSTRRVWRSVRVFNPALR